ncbi:MAG: hypothetical protein EON93_07940 [Burkholderiales bacterium]|nr:MAG: hypothetical protein EON93_07940 [Burkholderiales bacterium]
MLDSLRPSEPLRFWLGTSWISLLALAGGSARSDDPRQFIVQAGAAIVLAAAVWLFPVARVRRDVPLLLFAGCFVLLLVAQLIPLPCSVWTSLPGREFYALVERSVGLPCQWRPLTLTPALTLSTLFAVLPALATIGIVTGMPSRDRVRLMLVVLAWVLAGCILALLQLAEGPQSALRAYRITDANSAQGLLANRNHHAAFTAVGIIVLGFLPASFGQNREWARWSAYICLATGFFLLLSAMLSGSRAGTAAAMLACVFAVITYFRTRSPEPRRLRSSRIRAYIIVGFLALAAATTVAVAFRAGKTEGLSRILTTSGSEESRIRWIDPLSKTALEYFPFGAGSGSFDPIYRRMEPFELLATTYANHAHNEPLQIAIETGIPGLSLLALFLWWWFRQAMTTVKSHKEKSLPARSTELGIMVTAVLLLFSLGDYPLRTPLLGSIFIIACALMLHARAPGREKLADPESHAKGEVLLP